MAAGSATAALQETARLSHQQHAVPPHLHRGLGKPLQPRPATTREQRCLAGAAAAAPHQLRTPEHVTGLPLPGTGEGGGLGSLQQQAGWRTYDRRVGLDNASPVVHQTTRACRVRQHASPQPSPPHLGSGRVDSIPPVVLRGKVCRHCLAGASLVTGKGLGQQQEHAAHLQQRQKQQAARSKLGVGWLAHNSHRECNRAQQNPRGLPWSSR